MRRRSRVNSTTNPIQMDTIRIQTIPAFSARSTRPSSSKPNLFTVSFVSLLALLFLFSFYVLLFRKPSSSLRYAVIIDGGSTGSRIHVLGYRVGSGGRPAFDFGRDYDAMRVNPGLSSYAEDPDKAGGSLTELLEFGRRKVPRELWGETEIRLMATAGLRLLDLDVQDRILEACRRVLRRSGFKFKDDWAYVITGSDEGVYAWAVANYALGTLGSDPLQTTGIIELGGASAQVTFISSEPMPPEFSRTVKFGNIAYTIYSHSFLNFGQNVAFETLRESLISGHYQSAADPLEKGIFIDPCIPKGYSQASQQLFPGSFTETKGDLSTVHSRGNFSECRSAALMLLQKGKEKCSYQHCYIGSTFIPKLQGKFLATENFYHTSKFFGLGPRAFLSDLMMAGQRFCGEDWLNLKKKHKSLEDDDLMRYCFSSAYIVALLHDSLGIALDDERIEYANQVGNIPLDWALGAFILQTTAASEMGQPDWIAAIVAEDSPTLIWLIAIAILFMFIAWSVSKWRKPQLKTVYDLEKGRYIVTRIGRS